jgi:UDP-glucose 4-epimerase
MFTEVGKSIICGGAGFIGSHLVDRLIQNGHEVCVVDNLCTGKKEYVNSNATFYYADVYDSQKMREIFEIEKPECVFYLVSKVHWEESDKNPIEDIKTNIIGLLNVLTCCVEFSVEKIIYSSTIAVYGSPKSTVVSEREQIKLEILPKLTFSYALTKHVGELYILYYNQMYGLKYTILRCSHVYGPRQTSKEEVVSKFAQKLLNREPINIYGDGTQGRDFIYVDDVIDAMAATLQRGDNMIINIGSGKLTTINDLFNTFVTILRSETKPRYVNARKDEQRGFFMNISTAKRILLWTPKTTLKEGIEQTLTFLKNQ